MRKIAAFAAAALAVSAIGVGPAGATAAAPITGTISCSGFTGTVTATPGVSSTASTKAVKVKAAGAATSCDNSNVAGGKAPITAATIKVSGSLPVGATCTSLVNPVFLKTKIQVKFQGLNPSNKLMTVAVDNSFLASASLDGNFALNLVTQPILKGAFVGQTLTLKLGIDNVAGLATACTSPTGVTSLTFGHDNPAASSITTP